MNKPSAFAQQVYAVVSAIPPGKVMTYQSVAHALGTRAYRAVGRALHANPYKGKVPCHRVVFSDGSLSDSFAFGGRREQRERLQREGVQFEGEKVRKELIIYLQNIVSSLLSSMRSW